MNSKHIPYSFSHIACIFLLLIFGAGGITAQELQGDSIFVDTEMEDSLSALTIKPVENKKELLKQCMKRLRKDLYKQRHSKRQYLLRGINYNTDEYPSVNISYVLNIENDNGITLSRYFSGHESGIEWGNFHAEAAYPLTSRDSSYLKNALYTYCYPSFLLLYYDHDDKWGWIYRDWHIHPTTYREILLNYDVEAYRISDDSGRGVYRIDLVQRKVEANEKVEWDFSNPSYIIRLYFDLESLRLIQHKGGTLRRNGSHKYYKHDYGVENDSPILTHSQSVVMKGKEVLSKFSVQLIKDK